MCARAHAHVCMPVRVCVHTRPCVHACVRVCVCARTRTCTQGGGWELWLLGVDAMPVWAAQLHRGLSRTLRALAILSQWRHCLHFSGLPQPPNPHFWGSPSLPRPVPRDVDHSLVQSGPGDAPVCSVLSMLSGRVLEPCRLSEQQLLFPPPGHSRCPCWGCQTKEPRAAGHTGQRVQIWLLWPVSSMTESWEVPGNNLLHAVLILTELLSLYF
jgi:hypothetical protein